VEEAPADIEPAAYETTPAPGAPPTEAVEPGAPPTSSFEAALAAIRAAWAHTPPPEAQAAPAARAADEGAADAPLAIDAADTIEIDLAAAVGLEALVVSSADPAADAPTAEDIYELSASPSLHDLEADIATAAPPPRRPSAAETLSGGAQADGPAAPRQAVRRRTDTPKKRYDKRRNVRGPIPAQRPVQDEWGMFDPEQCGFSAVVDKLDEVTESGGARTGERTSVRVISFS
jgi:hypothetical protein